MLAKTFPSELRARRGTLYTTAAVQVYEWCARHP
jgi:hypothetical protein